ncbi:divalent-cation tolerance protein CutA [Oceanibacterium hippocampi]|uniref:Divalent-cation tolerance protein CutA n=1 Tax=Oceanibacterium hippocampi TaxID=745714 RepID=A0A1Y5SP50_9PROT|nr:divalent-cation tolerance protein CutA [Oceanibacterium hippocampi]SLN45185.1 Divalent-cation tolerance protein CutA [Oceanibacterium hippocampi]
MTEALRLLYVTTADAEEARSIGRAAVEAGLAACANVLPAMTSIYRWQGAVEEAGEAVLILKTRAALVAAATDLIRERHSYDLPCVVALPIVGGNRGFLDWIVAETGPRDAR